MRRQFATNSVKPHIRIIHLSERRPHVLTVTLRKLRRAYNCFSLLNQYVADSYVPDDAGKNYACNTLAFKMTRFVCVPLNENLRQSLISGILDGMNLHYQSGST